MTNDTNDTNTHPKVNQLLCYQCRHFGITNWKESDPTWHMDCFRGVWFFDSIEATVEDFKNKLETAETCEKFEPRSR